MLAWATIIALIMSAIFYVADPSTAMTSLAELIGVVALFTLVCAAEAFSEPRS
ncbi:hypothetical protein [Microvirga solisilvae]|uniref:hypothetical protein n=1 Tax=Microvirga solisilvae TaxID=2919498 RepID=UPI001FB0168C|nr:hypothetical protein [Microvirga solisilvae]